MPRWPGPLADGVVQCLKRQRGEDVVEGGDRGRSVALFALAPERAHGLKPILAEQCRGPKVVMNQDLGGIWRNPAGSGGIGVEGAKKVVKNH